MTKLSFGFTDDDMRLLRELQKRLQAGFGKMSYIAVIRWALRKAAEHD